VYLLKNRKSKAEWRQASAIKKKRDNHKSIEKIAFISVFDDQQ
jgi:hypothetical protein